MSVTIRRVLYPHRDRTLWWEVQCDDNGCREFKMLWDAKRWATTTFGLSGKWRRLPDGSYEEVTEQTGGISR